ncbi:MAG: tryptophan--tRNA ligase [Verrucomicrobiota bacterium]
MRILSGVQPSGALHLGNYFGMMQSAIALQEQGEAFYFIADYHAMTTVQDPKLLQNYIHEIALGFLACGLNPEKAVFFRQSAVPEVHELAWMLSTVTPMGLLERCHSFKDKISRGFSPSHGLFAYPVLMAADILLYQANRVPVGKDQKQHLEVTRDIALKFNEQYGEVFAIPEPDIREAVATVPGLDGQKMSKSYQNTLELFGEPKPFAKKVMGIKTDSTPVESPKPTEGSTLLALYKLVAKPEEYASYEAGFVAGGKGYGDLKKELLVKLESFLAPFQEEYQKFKSNPKMVDEVLHLGGAKARAVAQKTLLKAREAVGI